MGERVYKGQCHCGLVKIEYASFVPAADWVLRSCSCGFCTRHGARTTRDLNGQLKILGKTRVYSFGLATAEFHLCPECGVYVAAVLKEGGKAYATLNVNNLEIAHSLDQPALSVSYSSESKEERIVRRKASWTPTVFS